VSKPFRPMKPAKAGDPATLRYPLIAQPKIDGIRCLISPSGKALTCTLKSIPNNATRAALEGNRLLRGLDGELVVRGAKFHETSSAVMKRSGEPALDYVVFDDLFLARDGVIYDKRWDRLWQRFSPNRRMRVGNVTVMPVRSWVVATHKHVLEAEEQVLAEGYEGLILRDPSARYKYGRSTRLEQGLLRLKRFEDGEALIVGFEPLYTNENAARRNALGLTERSTRKAGKRRRELLGKFVVRDLKTNVEFRVGYGFTDEQRRGFWKQRYQLRGKVVKYRHQPYGAKDKPRIAGFLGIRDPRDL
jgi:DNA ligase-1